MMYATLEDLKSRSRRTISESEEAVIEKLLDDAGLIIDAYNARASYEAKEVVSCNMVIRAIGDGNTDVVPIGATQGSMSALGYSQSWTMTNGATGELYLTRIDKKLLGTGQKIGFANPFMEDRHDSWN